MTNINNQRILDFETGACGVGAVFPCFGKPTHEIVEYALHDFKLLEHRGGKIPFLIGEKQILIGDGAGIKLEIPKQFFREVIFPELQITFDSDNFGIGNIFLPIDQQKKAEAQDMIVEILKNYNLQILQNQWRKIPFDAPEYEADEKIIQLKIQDFRQIFIAPINLEQANKDQWFTIKQSRHLTQFQEDLIRVSLDIDKYAVEKNPFLAISSLSYTEIIYKGMLVPTEIQLFRDLRNPQFKSTFMSLHVRQATNTNPNPGNAQPCRQILHNGELNSVQSYALKNKMEKCNFWSDSRIFNNAVEELLIQNKSIAEALTILMPPPINDDNTQFSDDVKNMIKNFRHQDKSFCGPAFIVFQIGNMQGAKLDSCGLRPSRYVITKEENDRLVLHVNSEDVFQQESIIERGILKNGEMIMVYNNKIMKNQEILEEMAKTNQFTSYNIKIEKIEPDLDFIEKNFDFVQHGKFFTPTLEAQKYYLNPLITSSAIKVQAMGDDTPAFKNQLNPPHLVDYFKQKFSQVSSPPLDSEKEKDSFSYDTFLGKIPDITQKNEELIFQINSPIMQYGEIEKLIEIGEKHQILARISLTIDISHILDSASTNSKLQIQKLFENKLHEIITLTEYLITQENKQIIILEDLNFTKTHISLPDIMVVSELNRHLLKIDKHRQVSIVVNSTQIQKAHHISILCALGAEAVNPAGIYYYAKRLAKKKYIQRADQIKIYQQFCSNIHQGFLKAHLKTMAKYGIVSTKIYSSSRLVEAVSLDLSETQPIIGDEQKQIHITLGQIFAYIQSPFGGYTFQDIVQQTMVRHLNRYELDLNVLSEGLFQYEPNGIPHVYDSKTVNLFKKLLNAQQTKRCIIELKQIFIKQIILQLEHLNTCDEKALNVDFLQKIKDCTKELFDLKEKMQQMEDLKQKSIVQCIEKIFKNYSPQIEELCKIFTVENEKDINIPDEIIKKLTTVQKNEIQFFVKEVKRIDDQFRKDKMLFEKVEKKLEGYKQIESIYFELFINNEAPTKEVFIKALKQEIYNLKKYIVENNNLPRITESQVYATDEINKFQVTKDFKDFVLGLQNHRKKLPASILNEFEIIFPDQLDQQGENEQQQAKTTNINIDEVQDIQSILQTQVVGGISFGAITTPAHYSIFLAEKLINSGGACSGEGGQIKKKQLEPYLHFFKGVKIKSENSRIKQIASGRFGINPDFLDADVIEIKVAQGAKPGEGGQLPSSKVTVEIAAKRQSIPGIGLVSPPPHHDIYSIEDLKQLIYDLKDARPKAKVCVKLCASFGIDKIALGVAKSGADIINIASGSGGTGAASTDSIKFTGLPSEVGVRLVHKYLCLAKIRDLVKVQVSGSIVGPQDIIKFAILGADMFEWGTTELLLLGCAMLRKCNTQGGCTPGVTNNVKDFQGDYRNIVEFKLNVAAQIRNELARLGVRSLKELRGRTDLLKINTKFVREKFNFTELFKEINEIQVGQDYFQSFKKEFNISSSIDIYNDIFSKIKIDEFVKEKQNFNLGPYELTSAHRTFGAQIAIKYKKMLKKDLLSLHIKTNGNAGQSYGFLNNTQVILEHTGVCQDGLGKSCSGGKIILITPENERKRLLLNVRAGNSVGYGASGGKIFINGKVGQRCGVLMKGATIVVEGAGDFTCEYMTSGSFMSLEPVGDSFANGMYGGIAVLYNKNKNPYNFEANKNCYVQRISQEEINKYFIEEIESLLKEYHNDTKSILAGQILKNWTTERANFVVFIPKSLLSMKYEKEIRDVETAFSTRDFKTPISGFELCWVKFQKDRILQNPDRFILDLKQQAQLLYEKYTKIAQKMYKRQSRQEYIQQLGVLDYEEHEDNLLTKQNQEEIEYAKVQLTKQIQSYAAKCSCDAVSCTGEVLDLEDLGTFGGGCPINKNPNLINEKIRQNDYEAAFKIQVQQSPFAGITGSICPAPCQYSCTQAISDQGSGKAVEIKKIEFLLHNIGIAENLYEKYKIFPNDDEIQKKNINVAVIGSGPAGMEAAYHLRLAGFNVDVYEKDDLLGGLLRYGIPDHKFPKFVLDYYLKQLKKMGIKFKVNFTIDENNIESLREQFKYDTFIDARGVSNEPVILKIRSNTCNKLKQAGFENIFDSTFDDDFINKKIKAHIFALDFLMYCNVYYQKIQNLDIEEKCTIENPLKFFHLSGKKIVIIGAGDTAEDAKRSLSKLIYYSEDPKDKKTTIITLDRQPQKSQQKPIGNTWGEKPEIISQELETDLTFVKAKNMYNMQPVCLTYNEKKEIKGIIVEKLLPKNPGFSKQYRENKTVSNSYEEIACDVIISALGFNSKIRPLSNSIPAGSPISVVAAFASGKLKAQEYIQSFKNQERIIREIYFRGNSSKEYYVAKNMKTDSENGTQKQEAVPLLTLTLLQQFKQELSQRLHQNNGTMQTNSNEDELKSYSKILENVYENSSFRESSVIQQSEENDQVLSPNSPNKSDTFLNDIQLCNNKLQGDCAQGCKCIININSPQYPSLQKKKATPPKKSMSMSLKEILGLEVSEESKLFFYN